MNSSFKKLFQYKIKYIIMYKMIIILYNSLYNTIYIINFKGVPFISYFCK